MKKFCMRIAVALARFINLFFKPLKLRRKITVISRQSNEATLDIRLLADSFKEENVEIVILAHTLEKSLSGMAGYLVQMLKQIYHIATSKVIVLDGYCILVSVLPKKKGQKVVQMWHALGAIKKFGWQSVDNPDGHSKDVAEIMCMHKNYDYVIAPSKVTGKFFAEAFRTPFDRVVYYGLPKIDYLRTEDKDMAERILKAYPQTGEKINVLYVPTFRKDAVIDMKKLAGGFDFQNYNLIIKKHFLDKGDYSYAQERGAIVDEKFSSMEWLKYCSKVVTDYSAISLEAAVTDREIYIFQPDAAQYAHNVGLNMDMKEEALGQYFCNTEEELFDLLKEPYNQEAVKSFRDKYFEIDLDRCTEDMSKFIIGLLA